MRMPCEHGRYEAHGNLRVLSTMKQIDCPGGRPPTKAEMVEWLRAEGAIDYEAALVEFKKFWDIPFASPDSDLQMTVAAVDAALGGGE